MTNEQWWKSSKYMGVETWDTPSLLAEQRRRTLQEVEEMVKKIKEENTVLYQKNIRGMSPDGKLEMNAELNGTLITCDDILAKLEEMKK